MKEPTYQPRSDSNDAICPYCGWSYQVESEDYGLDGRDEECDTCGKAYFLETTFEATHTTTPNCELIGIEHDWEPFVPMTMHRKEHDRYRTCRVCGKVSIDTRK